MAGPLHHVPSYSECMGGVEAPCLAQVDIHPSFLSTPPAPHALTFVHRAKPALPNGVQHGQL